MTEIDSNVRRKRFYNERKHRRMVVSAMKQLVELHGRLPYSRLVQLVREVTNLPLSYATIIRLGRRYLYKPVRGRRAKQPVLNRIMAEMPAPPVLRLDSDTTRSLNKQAIALLKAAVALLEEGTSA